MYFGLEQYEILNVNHSTFACKLHTPWKGSRSFWAFSPFLNHLRNFSKPHIRPFPFPIFVICVSFREWIGKMPLLLNVFWARTVWGFECKPHIRPFPFPIFVINDTFREWILSFPVKNVPLHSRKLTLMSLFGNGHVWWRWQRYRVGVNQKKIVRCCFI